MKLNIGCGPDIKHGWVNCDLADGPGIDKVFDVSQAPIPFENNSVDEVLVSHVLEHIQNWETVVLELHRVLKPGGVLTVRVPYGVTFTPYHVRFFMPESFDGFMNPKSGLLGCGQFAFKKPLFDLKDKQILRSFWFGWHLKHYLGIGILAEKRYTFPIGKKLEIHWQLVKRNAT